MALALVGSDGTPADPCWRDRLLMTNEKVPKVRKALANIVETLLGHPAWQGVLRYNAFSNALESATSPPWHNERNPPGEWSEADDSRLVCWMEREMGPSFTSNACRAAVDNVARRTTYHPVCTWLDSLRWDGSMRLDTWLQRYCRADSQPADYLAGIGRWWMISAVARVRNPGCQADHLVVLEGEQGTRKSSLVRALGDPWTSSTTLALGDKDSYQALRNKWIVELAELAGMRRSDIERTKGFISSRVDSYRPSYARCTVDIPRQCVFVGTTNATEYLPDATGARRFWPVRCGAIDLPALIADREQLWAEASARHECGEAWHPDQAAMAALQAEQRERTESDPWTPRIASWLEGRLGIEVSMSDVLIGPLGKEPSDWSRADETRVGLAMHAIGWVRVRRTTHGVRGYAYVAPALPALPAIER